MAQPSVLLRFRIDLSDVDRSVYESLDFRIAQHPSETNDFLLTRVFAYALNYESDLKFSSGGLSDTDEPAIALSNPNGGMKLVIEVGSPSARRLHKDMKASKEVKVYTYKDPRALVKEVNSNEIHRKEDLKLFAFDPRALERLAARLGRDNRWSLLHSDGTLTISIGDEAESLDVQPLSLNAF